MNEIFGEENFVATIVWQKKYTISNDDPGIASMHDYVLLYRKSEHFQRNLLPRTEEQLAAYENPDDDPRGPWISNPIISNKSKSERPTMWYPIEHPASGAEIWPDEDGVWRFAQDEYRRLVSENRLYWGADGTYSKPRLKRFLSEVKDGVVPRTWWTYQDVGSNDEGQRELSRLFGGKVFSAPKPTRLIRQLAHICTEDDDLVLDFFAGSGSTGHAIVEHNEAEGSRRRYVMVQLPEPVEGGDFGTISEITRERMKRVAAEVRERSGSDVDAGYRSFRLAESNFEIWSGSRPGADGEQITLLADGTVEGATTAGILAELVLKAGFELTESVESIDLEGVLAFGVAGCQLLVVTDGRLTLGAVERMVEMEPSLILVLDRCFGDDDELKVNAMQTIRAANQGSGTSITLKVV